MAGATKQLMDVAKKIWRSLDFVISYLQASVLVGLVVSMVAPCWGIPEKDWKHTSYLHSSGKNPAENCCLFTCLMFILVVISYVSLSYHPESRHPFSKQPWLACYVALLGLTWKWSKRSHISWEWKLPSRDHDWTERANETAYLTCRVLIAGLLDQHQIHPTKLRDLV